MITGDLNVIDDVHLRNVMARGVKFRIPQFLPWNKVKADLVTCVKTHADKMSKVFKIDRDRFDDWEGETIDLICKRIKRLKYCENVFERKFTSIRSLDESIKCMHDHFVIVPVDKAANNFAVICKKLYINIMLEELGFDLNSLVPVGNATYSVSSEGSSEIVDRHCSLVKSFGINCSDDCKKLPKLFCIPKFHKSPYKFRFIAGARKCTSTQLSVVLNKGLSLIRDFFKLYCEAIQKNSGFRCFWSIKSTEEFLNVANNKNNVFSIQVFDFSTLYTNLNHEDICAHLLSLLELVFNSTSRKFLCVGFNKTFFAGKTYKGYHCFSLEMLKSAIKFVISEVFVVFGGLAFKQVRGIPMGGNCSPMLADLFLCHCEFVFMKSLVSNKKFGLARLMSCTTRYIDDICLFNYKHFDTLVTKIYPADLKAERNGTDNTSVEYLDVKLNICSDGLHTSVFHKVEQFCFDVIVFTFPDSLLPLHMGANVFASQVLRYLRICSHLPYAIVKAKSTFKVFVKRGYEACKLIKCMERLLKKHFLVLFKFGLQSAREFCILCGFI